MGEDRVVAGERADAIPEAAVEAAVEAVERELPSYPELYTTEETVRVALAAAAPLLPGAGRLERTDDRAYDLRQRLNRAVRWLREAEDIARVEMPGWPTADRIRDIYEQVGEDVLNGRSSVPPVLQRLREAEAEVDRLRSLLPGRGEAERLELLEAALRDRDWIRVMDVVQMMGGDPNVRLRSARPDAERAPQEGRCECENADRSGYHYRSDPPGVVRCGQCDRIMPDAERAPQPMIPNHTEGVMDDKTMFDVEPMSWEALAHSLQREKIELRDEVERLRSLSRPQGDEVETVARAVSPKFDQYTPEGQQGLLREAEIAIAALDDARSGADTVKLADVLARLRHMADVVQDREVAGTARTLRTAANVLETEFVSGADRPEGGRT